MGIISKLLSRRRARRLEIEKIKVQVVKIFKAAIEEAQEKKNHPITLHALYEQLSIFEEGHKGEAEYYLREAGPIATERT